MQTKTHWEQVYTTKPEHSVSWFQPHAHQSVQLIAQTGVPQHASVIDVGGGASTLVDDLLAEGYTHLTVLDLSEAALAASRTRLGAKAQGVAWLAGDITQVELPRHAYDVWHDRAVFHFLTERAEQHRYAALARDTVRPGGHLVMATFAPDGPSACSGLPVQRWSAAELAAHFADGFELVEQATLVHHTPGGADQSFTWVTLRRSTARP